MPSKSDDLEVDEPPTVEPYKVLGIEKTASADQVKTAYRKAALKCHPDKAQEADKESAHQKFQEVALAYAILSDQRRRARYDSTGRTDESLDIGDDIFNWGEFYRAQFADVITSDSISKFTEEYKGSDEEREALLQAYTKGKGDMDKVYATVMVSNAAEDDERFRKIINEAIENDEVDAYDAFTKESKKSINARIKEAQSEGKEAIEYAKELGVHDKLFGGDGGKGKKGKKASAGAGAEDSLAALIQSRQKSRSAAGEDFLAKLEAKYAPKGKSKGKRNADPDEPSEEAFQATAKRSKKGKSKA